jgi:glycosyltransferase involved in cell wall biosynthesis
LKRVLLIAFHFPPFKGSSGIQRALSFCRYLPENGWDVTVLTVHPRAHAATDSKALADVPASTRVVRAFALDSARHFAIRGRYLRFTALPDQWISWLPDAVRQGRKVARHGGIDAIVSTYPIATAHLIGLSLKRATGVPWVADFRDSMIDPDFPADPRQRASFVKVESRVMAHADRAVFAAPGSMQMYRQRYPGSDERLRVIENGYDETSFAGIAAQRSAADARAPVTLLHSGLIYPSERDPTALFEALAKLKRAGRADSSRLRVVLRASGSVDLFSKMTRERGVDDIVSFPGALPYREALAEMLSADANLVLQARNCNHLIPAKLYECFRARRPIVALTDPAGDTASKLEAAGVNTIASLDDAGAIAALIERVLPAAKSGVLPVANEEAIRAADRRSRARELAALLDGLAATKRG